MMFGSWKFSPTVFQIVGMYIDRWSNNDVLLNNINLCVFHREIHTLASRVGHIYLFNLCLFLLWIIAIQHVWHSQLLLRSSSLVISDCNTSMPWHFCDLLFIYTLCIQSCTCCCSKRMVRNSPMNTQVFCNFLTILPNKLMPIGWQVNHTVDLGFAMGLR